jgi:DNA-binding transcriptional LysR family regulator
MDINWDDARLFLAVAEAGSVSAAARRLQVAQPTVTRRLRELEEALGAPLFARGPGGVALTARGEAMLEPARQMSTWAAELSRTAQQSAGVPEGVVRITAPPGVAKGVLAPFAVTLRRRHPRLRLQVISSVEYLDLGRGQADLAIRMRPVERDESRRDLLVMASTSVPVAAYASASYVASLSSAPTPADIDWIAWGPPLEHLPPSAALSALIPGFEPAFSADDFLVQFAAAEAGVGAIILGDFGPAFAPHALVKVPIDLSAYGPSTISLVAAKRAMGITRVRAVADALVDVFRATRQGLQSGQGSRRR